MILLDTDVLVDVLRDFDAAITWLDTLDETEVGIPGLVAMELIQGCRNRRDQRRVETFLRQRRLYWPRATDCRFAFLLFSQFHLTHSLGLLDALVAATAVGLESTLATFNTKHYGTIPGISTLQPYPR